MPATIKYEADVDNDLRHDIEAFRVRIIRAMGGLRLIVDDSGLTDCVELDAVLDAIRAVPVTA